MFSSINFNSMMNFSLITTLLATVLSHQAIAQTTRPQELAQEIASTPPRSFAEIRSIFSQNVLYHMDCVKDQTQPVSNSVAASDMFQSMSMAISKPDFALAFDVDEQGDAQDPEAFKIGLRQQLNNDLRYLPSMQAYSDSLKDQAHQMTCVQSVTDDSSCVRINSTRDVSVNFNDENFDKRADYSQEMTIYPASEEEMYAKLRMSLTAYPLDLFNRRSGSVSYQQAFVCRLLPMTATQMQKSAALALLPPVTEHTALRIDR